MKLDTQTKTGRPQFYKSAESLKSALRKARETLAMATLLPLSSSRLQTPSGSTSDLSDCSSDYGYSALHGAVISHDLEYLDFLLSSGCELDQRDENGFTALHVGTLQKCVDGVQRLIGAGCNIEKRTKEGMSSLHIAVDLQDNDQVVSLLASSIPNINIKNKVGRTALHLSAKSGNEEYLKILLDAGCNRDIKDKFGVKAVDTARANNHEECVQLLLHYVAKKRDFGKPEDENSNSRVSCRDTKPSFLADGKKKRHDTELPTNAGNAVTDDKSNDTSSSISSVVLLASSICEINVEKANTTLVEDHEEPALDLQPECADCAECAQTIHNEIVSHELDDIMDSDSSSTGDNKLTTIFPDLPYYDETEMCSSGLIIISDVNKRTIYHQENMEWDNTSPSLDGHHNQESTDARLESTLISQSTNDLGTSCSFTSDPIVAPLSTSHHQQTTSTTSQMTATLSKNVSPSITKANPSNGMRVTSLHTRKLPQNGCHVDESRPVSMKDLYMVVSAISRLVKHEQHYSLSLTTKRSESDDCKKELLSCMATIPLSLPSFEVRKESLFHNCKMLTKLFTFDNFNTDKKNPNDILRKLLQDLKITISNATAGEHCKKFVINNNLEISPENRLHSSPLLQDKPRYFVELFLAASDDITVHREDSCKTLDELCTLLSSQDFSCIQGTLVDRIFTRTKFLSNHVENAQSSSTHWMGIFLGLEYVIRQDKTPSSFASSVFETLMNSSVPLAPVVMTTRPDFMELTIKKCLRVEESLWDEDKFAEVFLFMSHVLVNSQSLMLKYTDVLLRAAFSCCQIDHTALCSCILVRLGLLKSELKIKIFPHLKGPLLAITHVFAQDYFPVHLAGLFVSFLAKPSLRFRKVSELHAQALKAAMLKEILDEEALLGKGLKRICDVLAHGKYWETAYQCCDALFDKSFSEHAQCSPLEQGSSILVHLGLIKSELPIEVIKDIKNGLKLLQHAANGRKIPETIAPMLVAFLNKDNRKMYPCNEEVAKVVKSLNK